MSRSSIWKTLGVARTTDQAEIRRAYARRLKKTHPEDDPEGFKALRAAYEEALQQAQWAAAGYRIEDEDGEESEAEAAAAPAAAGVVSPDAPGPQPPPETVPEQAPAAVSLEPAAPVQDPDQTLDAACARLAHLVQTGAAPEQLLATAEVLLRSAQLDEVTTHHRVETWLADLIAWNAPASDPLVTVAIERFGWRDRARALNTPQAVSTVLQREEDLRYLRQVRARAHPSNAAFRVLSQPLPRGRLAREWALVRLAPDVGRLLARIHVERPTILRDLNEETVSWWSGRLNGPLVSLTALIVVVGISISGAIAGARLNLLSMGPQLSALAGFVLMLALVSAVLAAKVVGLDGLKRRWRHQWSWRASGVVRYGWAPAALAGPVLAALLPVHPAATVLALLTAAVVAVWANTVIDQPPLRGANGSMPWQMRMAIGHALLAAWWLAGASPLGLAAWGQISGPLMLAAITFMAAEVPLIGLWRQALTDATRRLVASVMAISAAAILWSVFQAEVAGHFQRLAAVGAGLIIMLHWTPAAFLGGTAIKVRYYGMMALGLFAAPALAVFMPGPPSFSLILAGVLLGGAVIGLVGYLLLPDDEIA